MDISKTSDHIQIRIMIQNPGQEPLGSSKAPNQDLKYMDDLFTPKIKIESKYMNHGCIKEPGLYPNMDQISKP